MIHTNDGHPRLAQMLPPKNKRQEHGIKRLVSLLAIYCGLTISSAQAYTPDDDPTGNSGALKSMVETGGGYDPHSGNATRSVTELSAAGAPGVYGLDLTRHWNSVGDGDYSGPQPFGAGNWSYSWQWSATAPAEDYAEDEHHGTVFKMTISVYFPDGQTHNFTIQRGPNHPGFGPPYLQPYEGGSEDAWSGGIVSDQLRGMERDGSHFWIHRSDGGSVRFEWNDRAGSYRGISVIDPNGLATNLEYDDSPGADGTQLVRVDAPGFRFLNFEWGYRQTASGESVFVVTAAVITGASGTQRVEYNYGTYSGQQFNDPSPTRFVSWVALTSVSYFGEAESAPGAGTHAIYRYDVWNDGTGTHLITGPVLNMPTIPITPGR